MLSPFVDYFIRCVPLPMAVGFVAVDLTHF